MFDPTGYSVSSYGRMINCEPRMSAYAEALRISITPGCSVIDIGAGSGIFSLLACQYGAGSVIAIEPNDAVELLRVAAVANGFDSRITVIQGLSTDYAGPKADVIISDLRGHLPLFERHIPTIIDARSRLLAPGGRLIPAQDRLFAALVHDPEFYRPCVEPWSRNAFGLDLSDGHRFAVNEWRKASFTPIELMSEARELLLIDYTTVTDPDISADVMLATEGPGEAHGFIVWFDAELAPNIGFSNAPGEPEQVYGQTFFPFERPIVLAISDRVFVKLRAHLVGDKYVWSWTSSIWRGEDQKPELTYRQSSFGGRILPSAKLGSLAPSFVPQPSPSQEVDRHCLSLFDGKRSLGDIADALMNAFPDQFCKTTDALTRVSMVAGRYDDSRPTRAPEDALQ